MKATRGRGRGGRGRGGRGGRQTPSKGKSKSLQIELREVNEAYSKIFGTKFQRGTGARVSSKTLDIMKKAIEQKNPWPQGYKLMYGAEASIISGTRKAYKKILAEITTGRAVEEADLPDAPVRESKEVTRLIGVRVEAKSKRDKVKDEIDALTQQQKASSDPEAQKDFQVRIDVL